jgi:glycosyltransferase involved in cell wall biosynthesis
MTKVSVIIPIYNVESPLEKCLDSVVNQTLSDIEIILVDDGSTDNSAKIAEKYARQDSRIKLIYQKNAGASAARNTGLEIATGEYISFIDSDDWVDSKMYEELIEQAYEHNRPNIIKSYHYKVTKTGITRGNSFYHPNKENKKAILTENLQELLKTCSYAVWASLWKKSFLDEYNLSFIKGIQNVEDIIFTWQTMLYSKEILLVYKPYYYYNLAIPISTTRSINTRFLDLIKAFKLQKEFLIQQNLCNEFELTYQTKSAFYFNDVFKVNLMARGIRFHRYPELKKFFDQMHEISKDWNVNKIDFTNALEKQKFLAVQEKNFLKYLMKTLALNIKLKALWLYVIKNEFN